MKTFTKHTFVCLLLAFSTSIAFSQTEQKAQNAFDQGDYEAAINLWSMAADRSDNPTKASTLRGKASVAEKAKKLKNEADYAWKTSRFATAEEKYAELLKLNPKDPTALARRNNNPYSDQMERAMNCFDHKKYEQALTYFSNAGPQANWTSTQLRAYRICKEEVDYSNWKNASPKMAEAYALTFINNNPNSIYIKEIKNFLYNLYTKEGLYQKALKYATTNAQKTDAQAAIDRQNNVRTKQAKKKERHNQHSLSWGFAPELVALPLLFTSTCEFAIPVEFRLLPAYNNFNISLGGRIARRGMVLRDYEIFTADNGTQYTINSRMGYFQFAPFARLHFQLGELFFVGAIGRMNINFGHSYKEILSLYDKDRINTRLNSHTYRPQDFLTPTSFTSAIELGLGDEDFAIYLFYSYDFTRPVNDEAISRIANNANHGMYNALSKTDFVKVYEKRGFLGLGLRFYFNN